MFLKTSQCQLLNCLWWNKPFAAREREKERTAQWMNQRVAPFQDYKYVNRIAPRMLLTLLLNQGGS